MTTLFGFGPTTAQPDAPQDPIAGRARMLRLVALAAALLLLASLGGPAASPISSPAPSTHLSAALAQIHPGALKVAAIDAKVHPALYTLETFPADLGVQTAFAYGKLGDSTLLATTYQNVLRASDPSIVHELPKSLRTLEGGARVDPSFPVHQVVLVRHGLKTYRAEVIAAELERDIAVLKIPGKHPKITPECVGAENPRIGDRTYEYSAGGVAGATHPTRSFGRITTFLAPEQIQSSQRVPSHGEGAPLVNIRGRVIGVAARGVEVQGFKGVVEAFTLSVDLNVAFEIAGQSNDCPKETGSTATTTSTSTEPQPGQRLTRAQLSEAVLPAVVSLESIAGATEACPSNCVPTGSGFGVYTDGTSTWIATNHHVLGNARFLSAPALTVRKDGTDYLADIVASSKDLDVALVKVDAVLPVLQPACGVQKNVKKGMQVAAVGSPGDGMEGDTQRFPEQVVDGVLDPLFIRVGDVMIGFPLVVTPGFGFAPWNDKGQFTSFGEVSIGDLKVPLYRLAQPDGYGLPHGTRYNYLEDTVTFGHIVYSKHKDVRHTAKIFHGNSGGPLLNMFGQVVGINERFGKHGERIAINIDRLYGSLAARAGIPNPCAATA